MSKHRKPVELSIPQAYDLGFCPVNRTSDFLFTILNPNLKPLNYQFKFTQFVITPSKGVLMPNSVSNFKIQFTPKQATVIVGTVVLEVEGEGQRVIRLSAVGKYPYLSVNSQEVDFGDVLVTKQVSKEIILKNNSQVPAQFSLQNILQSEEFNDNFYSFNPERGVVPAKMSYAVKVLYQPKFVDNHTLSLAKLICDSGNQVNLNLKGYSHKFNVNFSSNSINFGEIKLDSTSSKVLTIYNNSQLDTEFEFFTDPNNIFSFNEIKGTIQRNTYKKIIIEMRPRNTISYYERVYCLVRNHLLLYVDLIGTCYDLLIKPVPLLQVHVDTFRKRVIDGRISQIELKYIENNILLKLAKKGELEEDNPKSGQNFYQTTALIKEHPYILQKELFMENFKNQLICVSQDSLEFGFCDVLTLSGQKQIQITNKLQTKLNVFWINQKRQTLNGEYMTVFNIYPETAVLKPNVPTKFQVTFRPLKSNTFYFQHLQFYAIKSSSKISKKTLEDFQYKELKSNPQSTLLRNVKLNQTIQAKVRENVQSTEVFPPISATIRCVGHSFQPNSLPFIPIMKVFPSNKIIMKPALLNTSVYDSFELTNQSDTPIYFRMGHDVNKAFKFYPKIGLIEPKSFAIVAVEFTPTEYKTYNSTVNVHLNDMPGSNTKMTFIGTCTEPDIEIQNEGKIYFTPTFTGVYTTKKVQIKNLSKTKVKYIIEVPQKYIDEVHFEPSEKELNANQVFDISCYFTPRQKRIYKIKIPVVAIEAKSKHNSKIGYHNPGSASYVAQQTDTQSLKKQFWLELNGEGSDGNLQISHQEIDFNTVKITQQKKMSFKIRNTADCSFFIDLSLKNNDYDNPHPPSQAQLNNVFNLSFKQGTIPANAQIEVHVTFSPSEVANYDLKLVVSAKQKAPKKINTMKIKNTQPSIKCELKIKAKGNYPLLEIIDIRNDTLSVAALWQNFQIQKINNELSCNLDSEEKKYLSVQNLTYTESKTLEERLKNYEWNLGYVSTKVKARPRKVIITVKNYGGTTLDYSFKFPSDNKVKEQLWADPGEPTEEQAYQKAILEKNIFQIKPKIGSLQPGEVKDIELIYSPVSIDMNKTAGDSRNEVHKLKVVFQIQNGKSLVFNLKGTTLGPNQGLITVKKNHYFLPQAKIGLLEPIKFPIEINNVGSIKTNYKTEIIYEEGEYPEVLKIQNPSHFLMPGQNLYLYCLYKPLQKKIYNFKVLIHVYDFNKEIQVIQLSLTGNMLKNSLKKQEKVIPFQRSMVSEVGSKVFFSIEEINFEKMEANSTKYRVILLYNMSKENGLTYEFPTQTNPNRQGLTCGDKFIIEPATGSLEPSSFVQLKLTLTSSKNPSFYEGEIPCNVIWSQTRFSSEDLEISQKEMTLSNQRESLFLRIKKQSILEQKSLIKKASSKVTWSKKPLLDNIFQNIIESTINDPEIEDLIKCIQNEQIDLFAQVDTNLPASLDSLVQLKKNSNSQQQEVEQVQEKKDYSNHEYLVLNEEFREVTEIIMENTFFNIIQETTHQENDFLRVGKKFIQAEQF